MHLKDYPQRRHLNHFQIFEKSLEFWIACVTCVISERDNISLTVWSCANILLTGVNNSLFWIERMETMVRTTLSTVSKRSCSNWWHSAMLQNGADDASSKLSTGFSDLVITFKNMYIPQPYTPIAKFRYHNFSDKFIASKNVTMNIDEIWLWYSVIFQLISQFFYGPRLFRHYTISCM